MNFMINKIILRKNVVYNPKKNKLSAYWRIARVYDKSYKVPMERRGDLGPITILFD